MAYDFVYTDQLEEACRKALDSDLRDYEVKVRQNVLVNKSTYNTLQSRYKGSRNGLDNIELLDKYSVGSGEIFNTLRRFSTLSYKLGGGQAYRDFSIEKKFNISSLEYDDIIHYSYSSQSTVSNLYGNLARNIIFSSLKHGKNFDQFLEAYDGYHDFSKADVPKFGELPSKSNILHNLGTRLVSLWNTIGRLTGYSRTKVVTALQYRTRQDERVSSICAPWHGRILTFKEAIGLVPQHRNCRCTLVPFR